MFNHFRKLAIFTLCWVGIICAMLSYGIPAFSWTAMDYQPKTTYVVTEGNELKSDHNADGSVKVTSGATPISMTGTISDITGVTNIKNIESLDLVDRVVDISSVTRIITLESITNPVQTYISGSTTLVQLSGSTNAVQLSGSANLVQLSGSTNTVVGPAAGVTVSQKIPSTFYAGGKTEVTTAASALSFGGNTTDTCYIQSLSTNTDKLYIGGSNAVTTSGVSVIVEISPGDMIPLKWNNLLNPLWIISGTSPQYYYKSATLAPLQ